MNRRALSFFLLVVFFFNPEIALSKKRSRQSSGPRPPSPVMVWAELLAGSPKLEERQANAYKLSQYSQSIYQDKVVDTLIKCSHDTDLRTRVLCTKALSNASQQKHTTLVLKTLLERFQSDAALRGTVVRALLARNADSAEVQSTLQKEIATSNNVEDILAILDYFEKLGDGTDTFVKSLTGLYKRMGDAKIRRGVVKALSERAQGQDAVVALFTECSQDNHTPLALMCLSGLQQQAKTDPRVWKAVETAISSDDPDMILASLDVIQALPESSNSTISARIVYLIEDGSDLDIQEKAILALGVSGDSSKPVLDSLLKVFEKSQNAENLKIAAALVLGKQARGVQSGAKAALTTCLTSGTSKNLKTACQIGLKELEDAPAPSAKDEKKTTKSS